MYLPCAFDQMRGTILSNTSIICPFVIAAILLLIILVYNFFFQKKKIFYLSAFFLILISIIIFDTGTDSFGFAPVNGAFEDYDEEITYANSTINSELLLDGYIPGLKPVSDEELLAYADVINDARGITNEFYLNELYRTTVAPSPYYTFSVKIIKILFFVYRIANPVLLLLALADIALSVISIFFHRKTLKGYIKTDVGHIVLVFLSALLLYTSFMYAYSDSTMISILPALLSSSYVFVVVDVGRCLNKCKREQNKNDQ